MIIVDPISMCVSDTVYFIPSDYKMSSDISKVLYAMQDKLKELKSRNIGFEQLFSGKTQKLSEEGEVVSVDRFSEVMQSTFAGGKEEVTAQQWQELTSFLDQNNSGFISRAEYEFLYQLSKFLLMDASQVKLSAKEKLIGLSDESIRILTTMQQYLSDKLLSVQQAFSIFDTDNSGHISIQEFMQILDKICGKGQREAKRELIQFIDKDKSQSIELEEFSEIFGVVDYQQKSAELNTRTNLMLCFQKSYQADIDIEQLLLERDAQREGYVKANDFRNLLKWLPLGLRDEEIEEIMQTQVSYSDTGDVDYVKYTANLQFQEICETFRVRQELSHGRAPDAKKEGASAKQNIFSSQKVIIESIIYLDDFDLMVYTTCCPKTSLIFLSKTKKSLALATPQAASKIEENLQNILLAKLDGHATSNPPTIFYCRESGCLISGEKLDPLVIAPAAGKPSTQAESYSADNEYLSAFYAGIDHKRGQQAGILIWNLQQSLAQVAHLSPPWTIQPTALIPNAHNDSILSLSYLPCCQLIASTSLDKTVKLWNPVARPNPLKAPGELKQIMLKPGYYVLDQGSQATESNAPFSNVRTIFTGNCVCLSAKAFCQRVPVPALDAEQKATKKFQIIETLICLIQDRPQVIGNTQKSPGMIRGYAFDKMKIEIPCKLYDEIVPRHFYNELEAIAMERRRKAYLHYQIQLPLSLEKLQALQRVQSGAQKKIMELLKAISLYKFDTDATELSSSSSEVALPGGGSAPYNVDADVAELFATMLQLPSRKAYKTFLGERTSKTRLTANEVFYYLKVFHQLHPLTMTREKFFKAVVDLKLKSEKGIIMKNKQISNQLEKQLAARIRLRGTNVQDLFRNYCRSSADAAQKLPADSALLPRDEFKKLLVSLAVYTTEDEFTDFLAKVDPLQTNQIHALQLQSQFSSELIDFKLRQVRRPQEMVQAITEHLKSQQRMQLMLQLAAADKKHEGFLTQVEFARAFEDQQLAVPARQLEEVFEVFSEHFSESEQARVICLKRLLRKFFNSTENLNYARFMHHLGVIKGVLLDRGLPLDYPFYVPGAKEGLSVDRVQAAVLPEQFVERVLQLRIASLAPKDVQVTASALVIQTDKNFVASEIQLSHYLHFLSRIQVKDRFLLLSEYQRLYVEIANMLKKMQSAAPRTDVAARSKQMQYAEIKQLLQEYEIDVDLVEDLMIRVLSEGPATLEQVQKRLEMFRSSYERLAPKSKIQIKKEIEDKLALEGQLLAAKQSQRTVQPSSFLLQSKHTQAIQSQLSQALLQSQQQPAMTGSEAIAQELTGSPAARMPSEQIVARLKNEQPEVVSVVRELCRRVDYEMTGMIDITYFVNFLRNNMENVEDQLLLDFQLEQSVLNQGPMIDYIEFFDRNLLQEQQKQALRLDATEDQDDVQDPALNINAVYQKINEALRCANVNLEMAMKFFENQRYPGKLDVADLPQVLNWIKCELHAEELDALTKYLHPNAKEQTVRIRDFSYNLSVSRFRVTAVLDFRTWRVAAKEVDRITLEKILIDFDFLKQLMEKLYPSQAVESVESESAQPDMQYPIVKALLLQNLMLQQLKLDYTPEQIHKAVRYAIVGCQVSDADAVNRLAHLQQEPDISNDVINMEIF